MLNNLRSEVMLSGWTWHPLVLESSAMCSQARTHGEPHLQDGSGPAEGLDCMPSFTPVGPVFLFSFIFFPSKMGYYFPIGGNIRRTIKIIVSKVLKLKNLRLKALFL